MDWSVNPIFGSFSIIILVSLALMILLILVHESGRLSRKQSIALWSMRLAMCLLLLLVLLKPGVTFTKQSTPGGTVAILMDESSSMQLGSGEGKLTRWEKQKQILDQIWASRSELGTNSSWMPFLYSSSLRPLAQPGAKDTNINLPSNATEGSTDIGGPIGQLLTMSMESPLSALIWMGDGSQTLSPEGGDPRQLSRRLAQMDVPIYIVGIGPRADSENSKDLSLGGVPEQLDVFTKNQVSIVGTVRCRGFANRPVSVGLYMKVDGQPDKPLVSSIYNPTRNDESIPFQLGFIAPDTGAYELIVRADGEGDASPQNNSSNIYLNVRKGGARILFVEGEARFEMKYIRSSVGESQDLTLTTRPVRKPPIQKWPVNFAEQLEGAAYDCIILGDIDFRAFENVGADIIATQVKNGTGLITLGGYHSYTSGGWGQSNALREILPVQLGNRASEDLNAKVNLAEHIPGPIKLAVTGSDQMLQLDPNGGASVWETLAPLNGANRWSGIKRAGGTKILANSTAGDPMIVSGQVGKGKIVCLAFDSTYLWYRQGKQAEHKAFWRQLIYWCMRREAVEEGMQIRMSQRRLVLEKSAEAVLEWVGGSENVEMPPNISMHLWKMAEDSTGKTQPIDLGEMPMTKRDNKSWRATFQGSKEPGRYEWRANTTIPASGKTVETKLPFVVQDNSIENMQPIPDWSLMEQMARLNESAGGMLVSPDSPQEIVKQLIERRKIATETIIENRRLGDSVVDSWLTFLLLGGLMIGQWFLRKRWNLP
jgi:uncharacterized membrane protein